MKERLGDAIFKKSSKSPPEDYVYRNVFNHIRNVVELKVKNSASSRILVQKPNEVTERDFEYILTDSLNLSSKNFQDWMENQRLSAKFVCGELVVSSTNFLLQRKSKASEDILKEKETEEFQGHGRYRTDDRRSYRELFSNIEDVLKRTANLIVDASKTILVLSPIIGFFLLASYLNRVTAPFPTIDSSISLLLLIITFVFAIIMFYLADVVAIVEICKGFVRQKAIRSFVPSLRPEFSDTTPSLSRAKKVLSEYFVLYSSFLLTVLLLIASEFRPFLPKYLEKIPFNITLLTNVYHNINIFMISFFPTMSSSDAHITLSIVYGFAIGTVISILVFRNVVFLVYSAIGSFASLMWFLISYFVLNILVSFQESSIILFLFIVFVLIYCHMLANISVHNTLSNIAFLCIGLLLTSLLWPGPSVWGAVSLRALGVGGDIPATFQVRSINNADGKIVGHTFKGCLILMTSNQVILRKGKEGEKLDCSFKSDVWRREQNSNTFSHADVYLRSDVLHISSP